MFTNNKVFVDSSIIVEFFKGTKTELFEALLYSDTTLVVNPTVISEVTFHYLALIGNKAQLTLKVNKEIAIHLNDGVLESSLSELQRTENNASLSEIFRLMKGYNLLPNDAIILADTLHLGLKYIATFDKDLIESSAAENIIVIDSPDRFKEIF